MNNKFQDLKDVVSNIHDAAKNLMLEERPDFISSEDGESSTPQCEIEEYIYEVLTTLEHYGEPKLGNNEDVIEYALASALHIDGLIKGGRANLTTILGQVKELHTFVDMDEIQQRQKIESTTINIQEIFGLPPSL